MNRYELGGRMGDTMLYHREGFPPRLIGPVEILWEPHTGHNERRIWLRLHPSIFEEAWDALKAASTIISSATSNEASSSCHDQPDMVSAFQMRDLREDIDAFEILGPKAGLVLRRVLRLCRDEVPGKAQVCHHSLVAGILLKQVISSTKASDTIPRSYRKE